MITTNIKMANVFYSNFSSKKLNEGGWSSPYGRLYLRLTCPLEDKGEKITDKIEEIIEKGLFKYVGGLKDCDTPDEAWKRTQNVDVRHELNKEGKTRSMMVGDVVIIGNEGWVVEGIGWAELNKKQIEQFKKLIK
jgi:hypothetical protein